MLKVVGAGLSPWARRVMVVLEGRSYLVGDMPYLGDITLASVLLNYLHAGERIDPKAYPNLSAFLKRMFERKSFAARIEDDLETLGELSTVRDLQ